MCNLCMRKRVLSNTFKSTLYWLTIHKLEYWPFFIFNFKETPSQDMHKPLFSALIISRMTLTVQSDFQRFSLSVGIERAFYRPAHQMVDHWLINYIDIKAKCRHLKSWPGKGLCGRCLWEFIYWIYSQSCWYFLFSFANYSPSNLLSGSSEQVYSIHVYSV
jgi:hypothetical protein